MVVVCQCRDSAERPCWDNIFCQLFWLIKSLKKS